ncbi:hypothetical protein EVAR_30078_1 [Eumeta japonica]|uniref:Uncharacterized protein n=1 Tax=Eumeta variegata TaxID=151549 RepID=A0A4C1XBR4_EUMVA|nr:hypothetical protein EVAR_30078_1 [Eumeta japonica]
MKRYRLYNPKTNKVITRKDVTIIEQDNSEMMQAVVHENNNPSSESVDQLRDDGSDLELSTSTMKSNISDSSYTEEKSHSNNSSVDKFFDSVPVRELKNFTEFTTRQESKRKKKA